MVNTENLQMNLPGAYWKRYVVGCSLIRPEATGYGTVYFVQDMLAQKNDGIKGKKVVISGSGNVAQYAAEKILHFGGKVLTMSDSSGFIYDPSGIDEEKLKFVMYLKIFNEEESVNIKKYPKQF